MIVDARSVPRDKVIDTDVCIVGAGVAGITLAREFIEQQFRVCLLESGGLAPDKETQSLYCGENVGHPYYPLETARARQFGGSSNRWLLDIGAKSMGARLRPLDEIDFEEREWVAHSGWPFSRAYLDPYYERAQAVCKAGPFAYDVGDWKDDECNSGFRFIGDRVQTAIYQFVTRDVFTADYREEIEHASNITTYVFANALELETTEAARTVTRVRVGCLHGKRFWVTARLFVIAAGGLETPRLLLLSNKAQRSGLGNQNDLVGRFFIEHPHLWSGICVPAQPSLFSAAGLYKVHTTNNVPILGQLTLSRDVIRSEKLLNYSAAIVPGFRPRRASIRQIGSTGVNTLKVLASAIRAGDLYDFNRHLSTLFPVVNELSVAFYGKAVRIFKKLAQLRRFDVFRLNHMVEQAPNPNSRVSLAAERDAFGQNRIRLDWQLSPIDIRSIVRAQEIIDEELRRSGLGHLEIEIEGDAPPSDLHGGWHHMGTTRMHRDERNGVVDENSKVHQISNLFIAGPSVFPTSGYANPALTIVALTVRLADHIKGLMARSDF